jgi:serine/threonine protein kinase, bacterial
MGVVWRGHDRTTGAVYAIKVLLAEYARDPAAVGRFVRERTALVAFRHPNVVTVHDMIVEGDQLALVMDLISGGDLEGLRKARGGRLAPAEAAALAAQIGDGLAAAHAAGIVHRDVKPANALLNNDHVLLADFGIALLAGQPRVTTEGRVLGTSAYMAPEVIAGREPGPAADVYALGITLYELLAGQPPFVGNTAAVLHAHGTAAPPYAPGIPEALWEVISGCLAKDPAARPSTTAVATALHEFAAAPATLPAFAGAPVGSVGSASGGQPPAWAPGAGMWPDPLQAVQTTPFTEERPPLATPPRRSRPAVSKRTLIIAAGSAAAVALLVIGAIILNPFGSSPAGQSAELAGSGRTAAQSASASASGTRPGARASSSRRTGSKVAGGRPGSSPSPDASRTGAKGKPSASPGTKGSTGPSSSASPSSSPSPSPSSTGVTDAGGLPILYAGSGKEAHECTIIGSAEDSNIGGIVEGLVCADIATSTGSGGYMALGQIEIYCQTTEGATIQCADAITTAELVNASAGVVETSGSWQCGHSYGPCATGRNYVKTIDDTYSASMSDCSANVSDDTDAWGLAVGGGSTEIQLPGSDDWVSLTSSNANDGGSQSSGHFYICP